MLWIDSHAHGMHAQRDAAGNLTPPLEIAWSDKLGTPEQYVEASQKSGIDRIVLLDPPEITFKLRELFGDYVIPVPQVDLDTTAPETIDRLFRRGAVGIKFISPERSYGHDAYFPIYDAIRAHRGLAVFHTGFLSLEIYEPGGLHGRKTHTDITTMRPAALDRVARAFPKLKILMAHFGNPWWEEAWKICSSHKNIFADFSGGTCYRRSLDMWGEMFAPNGRPDLQSLEKLCFGTDAGYFSQPVESDESIRNMMDFYRRFFDRTETPEEIRGKICRDNLLNLIDRIG
jgi:predicted TIM-barrel fold metal-dependent hydrolase